MRIVAGKAKGTKLYTLEGENTRPTLDRVKESLFNILQPYIQEANVLDLFAGSGALGIEALSRGAKKCTFCDKSYEAIQMLEQNLERTRLKEKAVVLQQDYKTCLQKQKEKLDIILLDPPYKKDIAVDAVKRIVALQLLNQEGLIVIETDEKEREELELKTIPELEVKDVRKYGRVNLLFLHERG